MYQKSTLIMENSISDSKEQNFGILLIKKQEGLKNKIKNDFLDTYLYPIWFSLLLTVL